MSIQGPEPNGRSEADVVPLLVGSGHFGTALFIQADREVGDQEPPRDRQVGDRIIEALRRSSDANRALHIGHAISLAGHVIDHDGEGDAVRGRRLVDWLDSRVLGELSPDLQHNPLFSEWQYEIELLRLVAANNSGDFPGAAAAVGKLEGLEKVLVDTWHSKDLRLSARVQQVVRYTDSGDYGLAVSLADDGLRMLGKVAGTLGAGQPQVQVRRRGALQGAKAQALMAMSVGGSASFDDARASLDEALVEFDGVPGEVSKQKQFRAWLETLARNFTTARRALADSIGQGHDEDLNALGAWILDRPLEQLRFQAWHWLRLAAEMGHSGDLETAARARDVVVRQLGGGADPFASLQGQWPWHGLQRQWVRLLLAVPGSEAQARQAVDLMADAGFGDRLPLGMVLVAAETEVLVRLRERTPGHVADLPGRLGGELAALQGRARACGNDAIADEVSAWLEDARAHEGAGSTAASGARLLDRARRVIN